MTINKTLVSFIFGTAACVAAMSIYVNATTETKAKAEWHYQKAWCDKQGGNTEEVLPDQTRADCVTDEYIIEVDFDYKWKHAIGQALHYSKMRKKKAGILIIQRNKSRKDYAGKLRALIEHYNLPITVWTVKED